MSKEIEGIKKYILNNHPDPDTLLSDIKIFDQMCRLAENYAKSKSSLVIIKEQQQKIEQLEKIIEEAINLPKGVEPHSYSDYLKDKYKS